MEQTKKKFIVDEGTKRMLALLVLIVIVMAAFLISVIVIKVKKEKVVESVYLTITDVPGCTFDVVKDDNYGATAVMEVSKNIDFLDYQTYSYRNGEDLYLLFNMRKYIVAVQRGTTFAFGSQELGTALGKNSLNGIWFSPMAEAELTTKKGVHSIDVAAQVSLTNNLYDDFYGKLVTFEKDGEEWALFVGAVTSRDEAMNEMIAYIAESFASVPILEKAEDEFEVSLADGSFVPITKTKEEELLEKIQNSKNGEDAAAPSNVQAYASITEEAAYTSSIYAMLPMDGIGYMEIICDENGQVEPCYVRLREIYDATATQDIVAEYCASGRSYYNNFSAPDGCHLEAVRLDVKYTSDTPSVVDVRLKGADGENLKYRGLEYSQRTYEIEDNASANDGWFVDNIYFFIVPDGCEEYAINIGGYGKELDKSAWYWVE